MASKKQPILDRLNFNEYFEAQKAMAAFTFVYTPNKSFWEIKGKVATSEQIKSIAPALIFHNPKGTSKDPRHLQ